MQIQTSFLTPSGQLTKAPTAQTSPQPTESKDSFIPTQAEPQPGLLKGPLGRALYGAALYGIPAIAGATMGINGVLPGAALGAGIGATTHLQSGSQAGIFAATGAVVGGAAGYIGFLGAAAGFKIPAVVFTAVVGAGSQALLALTRDSN